MVARFAPVFPVAAPLGEAQRETQSESVLGGGDGSALHAWLCTCVCMAVHTCARSVCVFMCVFMCPRGWCDSLPPHPNAHLGTLLVPPR